MQEPVQKLLVVIASDEDDADRLIAKLVENRIRATKISSTGGFLRKGTVTILSGTAASEVDRVVSVIRRECEARTEIIPASPLPSDTALAPVPTPLEVRVGGAIVFVLPVERFEKT